MELLDWVLERIDQVGPAEFLRQLNYAAEALDVKPVSLEAVMRWSRGEVKQLYGRSQQLVQFLMSLEGVATAVVEQAMVPHEKWFNFSRSFIMTASEAECIALLPLISSRLETLMNRRTTAVATLVRAEFLQQGLSIVEPRDVRRFTAPAGSVWKEGYYPQMLDRLLSGTLSDAEIPDRDLVLIAACLSAMSGNPLYSADYIRQLANRTDDPSDAAWE